MKILCFGDSNTYGYDPRSYFGGQYPSEHRWVDLLAQRLGGTVINAGENGREIPRREGELQRFARMLSNQKPLDLLLVMLGGNDLLQGNSVGDVAQRMESFLTKISLEKNKIVLIRQREKKINENIVKWHKKYCFPLDKNRERNIIKSNLWQRRKTEDEKAVDFRE